MNYAYQEGQNKIRKETGATAMERAKQTSLEQTKRMKEEKRDELEE